MKVLKVFGDGDYGANHFLNEHGGTEVSEIIKNIEKYLPKEDSDEYEQWELEVKEFEGENVNADFLKFIKNEMVGYDQSNHETFYIENEKVA